MLTVEHSDSDMRRMSGHRRHPASRQGEFIQNRQFQIVNPHRPRETQVAHRRLRTNFASQLGMHDRSPPGMVHRGIIQNVYENLYVHVGHGLSRRTIR